MREFIVEERLAILETKVTAMIETNQELNKKIELLLELRHKGVGAFWVASGLFGTTVMGVFFALVHWLKSVS